VRSNGEVPSSLFSLPHKARPNTPLYRRSPERFYWFEYLESSRTLYVKYNSCQNSPVLSMTSFVTEIGALAASNPIARAVIDVGNNGGGDSGVIKPLSDSLAQALAAGVISKERLFVILGRDTFSSSSGQPFQSEAALSSACCLRVSSQVFKLSHCSPDARQTLL